MEFPRPDFVAVVVAVVVVSTTAEVKGLRVGARVAADSSQGFSKPRTPFWMASKDPKENFWGGVFLLRDPPKWFRMSFWFPCPPKPVLHFEKLPPGCGASPGPGGAPLSHIPVCLKTGGTQKIEFVLPASLDQLKLALSQHATRNTTQFAMLTRHAAPEESLTGACACRGDHGIPQPASCSFPEGLFWKLSCILCGGRKKKKNKETRNKQTNKKSPTCMGFRIQTPHTSLFIRAKPPKQHGCQDGGCRQNQPVRRTSNAQAESVSRQGC